MVLDRFDHDDGIVDDETDGENETEERQCVDGKSDQREDGEGADEGNRNGEERNQRGAPALQKDKDDDDDEEECLEERFDDFLDARSDGLGCVERFGVGESGREAFGQAGHQFLRVLGRVERIRPRCLVAGDDGRRFAVEAPLNVVVLRAELDLGHVLEQKRRSVGVGTDDDVAEFLDRAEVTLRDDRFGEFLSGWRGRSADLAGGIDAILRTDGLHDFVRGDIELGQLVGTHPDAHGVLPGAENGNLRDTVDASQLVVDVDVGVVGEEGRVEFVVRRIEREEKQWRRCALLHGHAKVAHGRRQLRGGLALPHLREDLVGRRVGLHTEENVQRHLPVVRVDGIHVFHVVDAVDLLLDGRGDRLLDGQRISADVGCQYLDLRRDNVRVLRDGQTGHRDESDNDRDDGDDHRHDRPVDEELRHEKLAGLVGRCGGRCRGFGRRRRLWRGRRFRSGGRGRHRRTFERGLRR